jgi:hypothetical protein
VGLDELVIKNVEPRTWLFRNRVERHATVVSGMDGVRPAVETRAEGLTAAFHKAWTWSLVMQFAVVSSSFSEGLGESERKERVAEPAVPQDYRPTELADHVCAVGG